MARPETEKRTATMTTIGSFLRTETGFSGSVNTSSLHIDNVRFIPAEGSTVRGALRVVATGGKEDPAATAPDLADLWAA